MANRQNADDPEDITYYVSTGRGEDFMLTIKSTWKVTFGAVNPNGGKDGGYVDRSLHCMRVWEGEKLRAVFCDVRGFRDLSLPLARKVSRETGSTTWTRDDLGNFEASQKRLVEESYVDVEEEGPF